MKVNITDRLRPEEEKVLEFKGKELKVNDDAITILTIMEMAEDEGNSIANLRRAAVILFGVEAFSELMETGISFENLNIVIDSAMDLVLGRDRGEVQNPTTISLETGI